MRTITITVTDQRLVADEDRTSRSSATITLTDEQADKMDNWIDDGLNRAEATAEVLDLFLKDRNIT